MNATLTQKEAAAHLGIGVRQFVRYRRKYPQLLEPVGLTGIVPLFRPEALEQARERILADKRAVLARLAALRARPAAVVTTAALRRAKRKANP